MIAFKIEGVAAQTLENLLFPECLEGMISTFDDMEGVFIDIAAGDETDVTKEDALQFVSFLRGMRRDFTKILREVDSKGLGYERKEE